MTVHSFQCPACGAPLIPSWSSSIISCPYCGASVIVPEELQQLSGPAAWSTVVFDSFASNENNWLVGDYPSHYFATLNQVIADGRYRWEAKVNLASTITTAWLSGYQVSDFHLIVTSKHIRGSRMGSSCGALFRIQDNHNFYWFHVTDSQLFAVSVQKGGQWLKIVDWTRSNTIKPNGVNQIEVIARKTHFTFLINGQIVSEVDDDHFSQGLAGLAIEAYVPGEELIYDFMDITLRAP